MNQKSGFLIITALVIALAGSISDADPQVSPAAAPSFLTEAMIRSAKPFFDRPYPNDPGQAITRNGITVYRPNHGIVQGARVAVLIQDLIHVLLSKPAGDDIQTWLRTKLKDPTFPQKISMIALLHRTGRTDESDSSKVPEKRVQELATSANNFETAVATCGIVFTPQEIKDYRMGIILDTRVSGATQEQINLARLLRSAHAIDLIRDNMPSDDEVTSRLPLSEDEVVQENAREQVYLNLTGVTGGYTDIFFELSNTPKELATALDQAEATGWPIK